jgi:asparagine synthase (glutamine-hydrolysing)
MCGFLGWFKARSEPWTEAEQHHAQGVLNGLQHRGPDDESTVSGAGFWLGFRRLAILDLTDHARQPMSFGAGRYTLAFNGEIYNYRELRPHDLPSTGDTAVLGALLESKPLDQVLQQLRGMFAFAWWDNDQRSLVVARDHFGIKPLHYRVNEQGDLWIGSELRSVRALSGKSSRISQAALGDYLRFGAVQAPRTIFEDLHCLPPGHLLRWQQGRLSVERWFTPAWPTSSTWIRDPREQMEITRQTILDSVRAHLVSDVPVGVFLSGGLDSTIMAASMKHLGMSEVQAFSIGFEAGAGVPDETDAAERTALHLGCRFTRERLSAASLFGKLEGYFDSLDQPTGDALNTWLVSQLAAQQVKVTLSGLGADEWFAGYNYHRLAWLAMHSPLAKTGFGNALRKLNPTALQGHTVWKALLYATGGMGHSGAELQRRSRELLDAAARQALLGSSPQEAEAGAAGHAHWLHELLLAETTSYLPNTLLRDNDATSMAHSLELRVPLVDKDVFALAGQLPPEAKLSSRTGKRILRQAFHDLLPPWIADDTQKKTFTLPLMKWMREPAWRQRIQDTLNAPDARLRNHLHWPAAQSLLDRYFDSRASTKAGWHLSQPVWMLFVLENWLQRHDLNAHGH